MKPSTYRRVVTMNVNGTSVVQSDEPLLAYEFKTVPGYEHTLVWVNGAARIVAMSRGLTPIPTSSFRDLAHEPSLRKNISMYTAAFFGGMPICSDTCCTWS